MTWVYIWKRPIGHTALFSLILGRNTQIESSLFCDSNFHLYIYTYIKDDNGVDLIVWLTGLSWIVVNPPKKAVNYQSSGQELQRTDEAYIRDFRGIQHTISPIINQLFLFYTEPEGL